MTFGTLTRRQLKFKVSVKPLSPVHIGVGNEFLGRGAYHLFDDNRQLAILSPRPLASALLDHFGDQALTHVPKLMQSDQYPPKVATQIENGTLATRRMSVHPGAVPHLHDTGRNGGLKVMAAQANGLPYIPGSSLKGALRTAWLDWQTQQPGAYDRFKAEVGRANLRGRDRADDALMERKQIAEELRGATGRMQPQNRDVFRAVQVGDLLPDRTQNLTRVYAVLSMSYQSGDRGFARPSNGGQAGAQAWECLNPEAGATYTGTVTVDLDLLERMTTTDQDARNLINALSKAATWQDALGGYGSRVYGTETIHYEMLEDLKQASGGVRIWDNNTRDLISDWVNHDSRKDVAEKIMPLGMGVGLLAHSVLGVLAPEDQDELAFLGDEGKAKTLIKEVLDTAHPDLRRPPQAYADPKFPAPKSRRVTGTFTNREGRKLRTEDMKAERPLGWTELNLEVMPS